MDAEKKQQLYGGEISDYLKKPVDNKNDFKSINDIYERQIKTNKDILSKLRLDRSYNLNNKF